MDVSKKSKKIEPSITMAITSLAAEKRAKGENVIGFGAGEPDFDTPDLIKEAGIKAIQSGKTKYTPASGITELKQAIARKLKRDQGLDYAPNQIVISCGAKHSIYNVMLAILDPGDEVIIPSPYWVSYPDQVQMADGVSVYIETTDQSEFKITPEALKKAITPKTKAVILNSPSNPTGMIYSEAELLALAAVLKGKDIYVISDEIYEKLIYDGKHISIAQLSPELYEKTILVNGLSKAYSMTGWRIGYIACAANVAKAVDKIQSHSTSNPVTPAQWASVVALDDGEQFIKPMVEQFDARRKYMVDTLNAMPGITCLMPQGAFYAFPNISGCFGKKSASETITDSVSFCRALLNDTGVACVPGIGFGLEGYMRLSYATSIEAIKEGLSRLDAWVRTLS